MRHGQISYELEVWDSKGFATDARISTKIRRNHCPPSSTRLPRNGLQGKRYVITNLLPTAINDLQGPRLTLASTFEVVMLLVPRLKVQSVQFLRQAVRWGSKHP